MKKSLALFSLMLLTMLSASAQQTETYDYALSSRKLIQHGVQAILTCNGLFTSNRTLEQVYDQELAYLKEPVGTAAGGDYVIDYENKTVTISASDSTSIMRAAYRAGIGCVILAPNQTFEIIE